MYEHMMKHQKTYSTDPHHPVNNEHPKRATRHDKFPEQTEVCQQLGDLITTYKRLQGINLTLILEGIQT
jgi:hypothetical protein